MLSSEVTEGTIQTNGYLLDYDEEYYYLGSNADEISHCVKRDKVTLIQVMNVENTYTEMLETMEVPKNDNEKN